jgi:acetylornithine/N-succinyldiaminopimelate aminotransferase
MASVDEQKLLRMANEHLYPNYRPAPVVLVRGKGCEVWDKTGKRYLDLCAGVAVTLLGHAHPRYVRAIADQVATLSHVSNYFYNEPNVLLASELCRRTGMDRAFFCNSGAEANEAMLKLARHHYYAGGQKDRVRIVAFEEAFHGRTLGALSLTGRAKYREGFGLPEAGVTFVPFGDAAAVERAMGPDVAAVIVEPVQGEGGVIPAADGFLAELLAIAHRHGALFIADEVQTGIGRTGTFLACERYGVVPDAVTLAKGLGGGFPIGAMLCRESLASALPPGMHGCTFGGNPLASAAALAVLAVMDDERLVQGAKAKGDHLGRALSELCERHASIAGPERGSGLLRAVPLRGGVSPATILSRMRERGVLLTLSGDDAIRWSPPLVVTTEQLDEAVAVLDEVLTAEALARGAKPEEARG